MGPGASAVRPPVNTPGATAVSKTPAKSAGGGAGTPLVTAAYHRREDVSFGPVEGVPESALGLVRHRDGGGSAGSARSPAPSPPEGYP